MRGMQEQARSLAGGLGHLARGRLDIAFDHAIAAQCMARPPYEMHEHCKEMLRYVWATEEIKLEYPGTICKDVRPTPSLYREPIRPYDDLIDYDLYVVADMAPADLAIEKSKAMGGYAVMYAGGALEHRSHRFHTIIPDVASGETVEASRVGQRAIVYRRLCNFFNRHRKGPTPLFTDNDGTWYVSRDAANTTRMTYVINHVRILQQLETDEETRAFQVDTALNPVDPLTKHLPAALRYRHYSFLMGRPALARKLWLESKEFQNWKPKKIMPVPQPPISNDLASLNIGGGSSES